MIKAIGFDLGGVYLSNCWDEKVREKIIQNFDLQKEKFEKNNAKFEKDISEGMISEDNFLKKLIGNDAKMVADVKLFIRSLNRVIFPEMLEIINGLKTNYKVVLMNNEGTEWNEFRIKKFRLGTTFDEILTSCIMKDRKPNASYFEKALKRLNVAPNELLFIDDKKENVESARKIGITSIHFKNPEHLKKEFHRLKIKF